MWFLQTDLLIFIYFSTVYCSLPLVSVEFWNFVRSCSLRTCTSPRISIFCFFILWTASCWTLHWPWDSTQMTWEMWACTKFSRRSQDQCLSQEEINRHDMYERRYVCSPQNKNHQHSKTKERYKAKIWKNKQQRWQY